MFVSGLGWNVHGMFHAHWGLLCSSGMYFIRNTTWKQRTEHTMWGHSFPHPVLCIAEMGWCEEPALGRICCAPHNNITANKLPTPEEGRERERKRAGETRWILFPRDSYFHPENRNQQQDDWCPRGCWPPTERCKLNPSYMRSCIYLSYTLLASGREVGNKKRKRVGQGIEFKLHT